MRRSFFQTFHGQKTWLNKARLCSGVTVLLLGFQDASANSAEVQEPAVVQEQAAALPTSNSELFLSAQIAYDAGRYSEAATLYGVLVSNGVDNIEVHFNRANACFREGDLPSAVLNYRKAWYRAPRDPDIRANLHFALNAAGAIESAPNLHERIFTALSKGEWVMLATVSYIVFILLLILSLLMRLSRRLTVKLILLPTLFILLSTFGWLHWRQLTVNPERVVMDSNATALFGPIDGTTAHYKVPLGALVKQLGTDTKGWVEIEYDGKSGWLRETHIRRVSP